MADINFEDIQPFVEGQGDSGLTARQKIKRNFESVRNFVKNKLPQLAEGEHDLSVSDDKGYVVIKVEGGDIKTKKFDSSKINQSINKTCYVSKNGSDSNTGTLESPFGTVTHALDCGYHNVIVRGGLYYETIDFSKADGEIKIISYPTEEVIFMLGEIFPQGTLYQNDIYYVTTSSPDVRNIFQYKVDDVDTYIDNDKRHPLQGKKVCRCDCQRLKKVNSIELLVDNSFCYVDGKVYYKTINPVNNSNFLFYGKNVSLINNTKQCDITLVGINVYGGKIETIDTQLFTAIDCSAKYGKRGFFNITSLAFKLIRCEAARVEVGSSSPTLGDGIGTTRNTFSGTIDHPVQTMEIIDCWSHDNWQDGYSSHYLSQVTIKGGVYEFNCYGGYGSSGAEDGGGIVPSLGSSDIVEGCIVQYNNINGVKYSTTNTVAYGNYGVAIFKDVISRYNKRHGFFINAPNVGIIEFINCQAYGNTLKGFYIKNAVHVRLSGCKVYGNGTDYTNESQAIIVNQSLNELNTNT